MDKPGIQLDDIWQTEEQQRLQAYRAGKLRGIPMKQFLRMTNESYFHRVFFRKAFIPPPNAGLALSNAQ